MCVICAFQGADSPLARKVHRALRSNADLSDSFAAISARSTRGNGSVRQLSDFQIFEWYENNSAERFLNSILNGQSRWELFNQEFWVELVSSPTRWNVSNSGSYKKNGEIRYRVDYRPRELAFFPKDSNGLASNHHSYIEEAFKLWSVITGIKHTKVSSTRDRRFDISIGDNKDYKMALTLEKGTFNRHNITKRVWVNLGVQKYSDGTLIAPDYTNSVFSTMVHEIGHSLGLGHTGAYNGNADVEEIIYDNDSKRMSIMSYRDQTESSLSLPDDANNKRITPGVVDIYSIERLYWNSRKNMRTDNMWGTKGFGPDKAFAGNTDWGHTTNIDASTSYIYSDIANLLKTNELTIVDGGGIDTLYFDQYSENFDQHIDLRENKPSLRTLYVSDIGGLTNNFSIAIDSLIENAYSSGGDDRLDGNKAVNKLFGNDGDDSIYGYKGNDLLDGGMGADRLYGGEGDDQYRVDDANDVVIESRDNGDRDTVFLVNPLSIYDLPNSARVEVIRPSSLNASTLNYVITGNRYANTIHGGDGSDILNGGNAPRGQVNLLKGGLGDDTYYYHDGKTRIQEFEGGGTDTLVVDRSHELSLTRASHIENLHLKKSSSDGHSTDYSLKGNDLNNHIYSSIVPNHMVKYDLFGGNGDDSLSGGEYADVLNGGSGDDQMEGRGGDDVYYVMQAGDAVLEEARGGSDTIYTKLNINLNLEKYQNVENVRVVGTGSGLIVGSSVPNVFEGNSRSNAFLGNEGDDVMYGHAGDDLLNGGIGADVMNGGLGDDIYYIDDTDDVILESNDPDDNNDKIISYISYELNNDTQIVPGGVINSDGLLDVIEYGPQIEHLTLLGSRAFNGKGNSLDNMIVGNGNANRLMGEAGDDTIIGSASWDQLYGGSGADEFRFLSVEDSDNTRFKADRIRDFSNSEGDLIDLSRIDANESEAGDQSFVMRTRGAIPLLDAIPPAGSAYFDQDTRMLSLYTNSVPGVDMVIRVDGDSDDFILQSNISL